MANIITDGDAKFVIRKIGGDLKNGVIVAFSGSFQNGYPIDKDTGLADTSWHLCDGTHGTPDLRGRFILGTSESHIMGNTGGEETHALTEFEAPRLPVPSTAYLTKDYGKADRWSVSVYRSDNSDSNTKSQYIWTGNSDPNYKYSQPHNNMPPYYALAYIMKL